MNSYEYRDNLGNPRDYYDIVNDATKLCEEIEEKDKEIERLKKGCKELEKQVDDLYKLETTLTNENQRLDNIINEYEKIMKECSDEILKELNENNHLSYGPALSINCRLTNYKELKESK